MDCLRAKCEKVLYGMVRKKRGRKKRGQVHFLARWLMKHGDQTRQAFDERLHL